MIFEQAGDRAVVFVDWICCNSPGPRCCWCHKEVFLSTTMFSRVVAAFLLVLASVSAFVPSTARTLLNVGAMSMKMDAAKSLIPLMPTALAAPVFASDVSFWSLPSLIVVCDELYPQSL